MAKLVDFADLSMIAVPERTETYIPVSHQELITRVKKAGMLHYGREPISQKLETNQRGQQLFGSMVFPSDSKGSDISIGFRNSYDKTLPIGLCAGSQITVCSNLMFVGDIVKLRKHTQNIEDDMDALIAELFTQTDKLHSKAEEDASYMNDIQLSNEQVGDYFGQLFVNQNVLNGRQLKEATKQWFDSQVFKSRNLWSAYNACTEALKTSHPSNALENYTKLHTFTENYILNEYKKHFNQQMIDIEGYTSVHPM
jgi:hypothetical protein